MWPKFADSWKIFVFLLKYAFIVRYDVTLFNLPPRFTDLLLQVSNQKKRRALGTRMDRVS